MTTQLSDIEIAQWRDTKRYLWLMLNLTALTWIRFLVWMAVGLVIYSLYGRRHSAVANREPAVSA